MTMPCQLAHAQTQIYRCGWTDKVENSTVAHPDGHILLLHRMQNCQCSHGMNPQNPRWFHLHGRRPHDLRMVPAKILWARESIQYIVGIYNGKSLMECSILRVRSNASNTLHHRAQPYFDLTLVSSPVAPAFQILLPTVASLNCKKRSFKDSGRRTGLVLGTEDDAIHIHMCEMFKKGVRKPQGQAVVGFHGCMWWCCCHVAGGEACIWTEWSNGSGTIIYSHGARAPGK